MSFRRPWPALALVMLSLVLPRALASQTDIQRPTFRARADVLAVDVSVRRGSSVVGNLTADQFEVIDNGVPQQVIAATYGTLPIDVTVALDVSYSVTGSAIAQLRAGVRELMADLAPADRLKLILFNMRISRIVDFTTDVAAVDEAIDRAQPGGGSAVRDALAVAMVAAGTADRRQLVILFSDASDTSSTLRPPALIDLARRTNATVASVLPAARVIPVRVPAISPTAVQVLAERPATGPGLEWLRELGDETGGTQLRVPRGGQLGDAFRRVLDEFRASYVLHFVPAGVERGGFHALTVRVKGRDDLTIRARRGYDWR
jgi:VWFA-related protein